MPGLTLSSGSCRQVGKATSIITSHRPNIVLIVKVLLALILAGAHTAQSVIMPPRPFEWNPSPSVGSSIVRGGILTEIEIPNSLTIKEEGSIDMSTNSYSGFNINLNKPVATDIQVSVRVLSRPDLVVLVTNETEPGENRYDSFLSGNYQLENGSTNITVTYKKNNFGDRFIGLHTSAKAGHAQIVCNIVNQNEAEHIDDSKAYISVNVGKADWVIVLSSLVGWMYFTAWSVSFYFQVVLNFQRKSVIGLNFDFLALNLLGFICYTIYNYVLMYSDSVQQEYFERNKYSRIPVEYNDLFFAAHAVLLTFITALQCFIYERGDQVVSWPTTIFITMTSAAGLILLIISLFDKVTKLGVIIYLSYIKLAVTLIKYTPQAYMNYKRKSTVGWSIHNILLDFTGGILSITQMFLLAYNYDDWSSIFGNFTKFGLGVISISFDLMFVVQHYILYRQLGQLDVSSESESIPEPVISQSIKSSSHLQEQQQRDQHNEDDDDSNEI